jgi:urease gamma subunit
MNYGELTLAELKKEAKSKGIELNKYDTKETLTGKLNAYNSRQGKRKSKLLCHAVRDVQERERIQN